MCWAALSSRRAMALIHPNRTADCWYSKATATSVSWCFTLDFQRRASSAPQRCLCRWARPCLRLFGESVCLWLQRDGTTMWRGVQVMGRVGRLLVCAASHILILNTVTKITSTKTKATRQRPVANPSPTPQQAHNSSRPSHSSTA